MSLRLPAAADRSRPSWPASARAGPEPSYRGRWSIEPRWISILLTAGLVFPVGVALTRAAGGDLFTKSAGLTPLGLMLAALQIFFWPIIVLVYALSPEWTPWAMAILFGSHFLPY